MDRTPRAELLCTDEAHYSASDAAGPNTHVRGVGINCADDDRVAALATPICDALRARACAPRSASVEIASVLRMACLNTHPPPSSRRESR